MENTDSIPNQMSVRRILVKKLLNSGYNISPELFNLILKSDNPKRDMDIIIREISFIPSSTNHLTINELIKIPEGKLPKVISDYLIQHKKMEKVIQSTEIKKELIDIEQFSDVIKGAIEKKSVVASPMEATESFGSELEIKESEMYRDHEDLFSDEYEEIYEELNEEIEVAEEKSSEIQISEINVNKISSSSKSFNPLAKEFDFNYNILKDPTGKIHTAGEYEDFLELFRDKFRTFKDLMRKREDVSAASNIANIIKINQSGEVTVMGLITQINTTAANNKILEIEDLTGRIKLLIKNSTENYELFQKTNTLINDIMIFVEGYYRPGENKNPGIIFVNNFTELDVPVSYRPTHAEVPLSIALLSDTHIGSKEFIPKLWTRFIKFLKGEDGNKKTREFAGKIKYLIIGGDLIDGIGIYPNQKKRLEIADIYKQYEKAAELLSEIPSYIKIFYLPGSHEPVRRALPQPAVPKKYANDLLDIGTILVGDPVLLETEGVKTLSFHGDSLIDLNMAIPGLSHEQPAKSMKELLRYRHLAPAYGGKTQIAPISADWLVIDTIPDIFHTGHLHINGYGKYRNILLVNSGCFQNQTDYMRAFGITPTPGIVEIVELDKLKITELNLNS